MEEVGDISDVHAQFQVAVGQFADVQRIVNVLAARWVHAADGQVPQVLPTRARTCPLSMASPVPPLNYIYMLDLP